MKPQRQVPKHVVRSYGRTNPPQTVETHDYLAGEYREAPGTFGDNVFWSPAKTKPENLPSDRKSRAT